MFLADFHVHSNWSDGKLSLREVVDLYGKLGFGAIAITDHLCEEATFLGKAARYLNQSLQLDRFQNYLDAVAEEAERAWKLYRMVVIPGVEISKNTVSNSRSAHVLGLGITKYVKADPDIAEICRDIRNQGALTVAAHPVSTRRWEKQTLHLWDRREELRSAFDAWEVASGPHLFQEVLQSGLPMLANSDLHAPKQINAWKNVLRCERSQEAILDAIRRQNLEFCYYDSHCGYRVLNFSFSRQI
jgi:predicted metal-dependent phosphoesterase TrpH